LERLGGGAAEARMRETITQLILATDLGKQGEILGAWNAAMESGLILDGDPARVAEDRTLLLKVNMNQISFVCMCVCLHVFVLCCNMSCIMCSTLLFIRCLSFFNYAYTCIINLYIGIIIIIITKKGSCEGS
jgi:hypothetical protein